LISTEDILKEIRLPDYKGRHVFTARLRLLIILVFWLLSILVFPTIWKFSPFIPIIYSFTFLLTVICYNNVLNGRFLLFSFLFEMIADIFSITLVVYMTGGEKSEFFTLYILYCIAAGTFYSNVIALIAAFLSLLFFSSLVLLLYSGILGHFRYPTEDLKFLFSWEGLSFLNLALLAIFLPVVVYAVKIANHFSRVKERALEERNKQLIALNRISSSIKGFFSLEKVIRHVLGGVIDGLGYETCFLVIPSKKEDAILFYAPKDHEVTQKIERILGLPFSALRLPNLEENSVFQAIRKNRIVFRQELYELVKGIKPTITKDLADSIQKNLGFKKFIITPLVAERKVVGAFIGVSKNDYVDEMSVSALENFANQAALALESAQLFEELKQKNIDLEKANQIKGEFLAIMSHELRTPLTAVIGFTELLLEEVVGEINPEQREYLKEVVQNSENLLLMINSVLDFSKIESGKMHLTLEPFSLGKLVKEVKGTVMPLLKKKGLDFDIDAPPKLPEIVADERKLRQVLLNLVSNAIKFTEQGGKIHLELRYSPQPKALWMYPQVQDKTPFEEGYFKILLEDTGIGIEEKNIDSIFEPFSQVDSSFTRKYSGTGLGLALSKQFIEMHSGIIWVESVYGKGSQFTILLPIHPPEEDEKENTVAERRQQSEDIQLE